MTVAKTSFDAIREEIQDSKKLLILAARQFMKGFS